jgi:hypothetical protein
VMESAECCALWPGESGGLPLPKDDNRIIKRDDIY